MGKKKHKQQAGQQSGQQAAWGQAGFGQGGYGAAGGMGGMNAGTAGGFDPNAWNDMLNGVPGSERGFLNGLQGMVGSRQTEQFILGALIGAAAVYVLGDEQMRNKLLKTAMKLYAGIAGGVEEIKEQMADIRAEVEAEGLD